MKKHTKEYADSLAEKRYPETGVDYFESWQTAMRHGFSEGYLKAIEENAVPELIEALKSCKEILDDTPGKEAIIKAYGNVFEIVDNVLNKINQ